MDPFIAKIFEAWNISLSQLTSLGWRNLIAYAWTVLYKKFPQTLNLFRKLHWIKEDGSAKGKGGGKRKRYRAENELAQGGWMSLYTKGGKLTVYHKLTSLKQRRPRFF